MKLDRTFLITTSCLTFFLAGSLACPAASEKTNSDKTEQKSQKSKKKDKKDSTKEEDKTEAKEGSEAADAQQPGTTVDENSILGRMALTVKAYFNAKSPKEKLNFVLNPQETEPLMRDYYFREGLLPGSLTQMTTPEAYAVEGISFWRTKVALADGRQSLVYIRLMDDNTPKIDWGSEVRYSSVGWDEWLTGNKPETAEFRVSAQGDTHYPKQFEDRSKYFCIKVSSPDSKNTLMAYLNLQDPDQREFAEKLASGGAKDCILSLKQVKPEGDIKLATVEKVVSPTWILIAQNTNAQK